MTLLPYEATFPVLGARATLLTSNPEALLPAVEIVRAELDVFGEMDALGGHLMIDGALSTMLDGLDPLEPSSSDAEFDARSRTAQRLADLLAEELPGGFLVDVGGAPAVAGESLAGEISEIAELSEFSHAA